MKLPNDSLKIDTFAIALFGIADKFKNNCVVVWFTLLIEESLSIIYQLSIKVISVHLSRINCKLMEPFQNILIVASIL